VSGVERYIEQYQASRAAGGIEVIAPPDRRRMLALTAAFTPMVAVAALPVTALLSIAASVIANVTERWVGIVVLVAAVVGLGYLTARWGARYQNVPATRGWRRWLPPAVTVVVVVSGLAEIVTGSRAPDPVIALWFTGMVWVFAFLPLAAGEWSPSRRALWLIGPAVTFVTILFVWTQGFFLLRFGRAESDLDALAQQVADGAQVADGTHVGGFAVHQVGTGIILRSVGCDVGFWITGWHQEDTRYIAHCAGHPRGEVAHLAGDWWELKDRTPPPDL
jgi:hypothetical protein